MSFDAFPVLALSKNQTLEQSIVLLVLKQLTNFKCAYYNVSCTCTPYILISALSMHQMQNYFVVLTNQLNLDRNLAFYAYNTHLLNIQIFIYTHNYIIYTKL